MQVQRMLMSGVTRAFGRWCAHVDEIYENRAKMTKIVLQLQRLATSSAFAKWAEHLAWEKQKPIIMARVVAKFGKRPPLLHIAPSCAAHCALPREPP